MRFTLKRLLANSLQSARRMNALGHSSSNGEMCPWKEAASRERKQKRSDFLQVAQVMCCLYACHEYCPASLMLLISLALLGRKRQLTLKCSKVRLFLPCLCVGAHILDFYTDRSILQSVGLIVCDVDLMVYKPHCGPQKEGYSFCGDNNQVWCLAQLDAYEEVVCKWKGQHNKSFTMLCILCTSVRQIWQARGRTIFAHWRWEWKKLPIHRRGPLSQGHMRSC